LVLFKQLTKEQLIRKQFLGRFDEHLVSLYSIVYGKPYIYKDTYLAYFDKYSQILYLSLFELQEDEDRLSCIKVGASLFKPEKIIVTSPQELPNNINSFSCYKVDYDEDYQVFISEFDETLKGGKLKHLRYRVHNAEKLGYRLEIGKKMTPAHFHIVACHEQNKKLDLYDSQLYLGIWEYVRKFDTPRLFNVFHKNSLLGFDLVDFFADIMTIPLGFYTKANSLADFILYKEILYAKEKKYEWLDLGWACEVGVKEFKRKWCAIPRFKIWAYEYVNTDRQHYI
jgi:hypothetical protein